MKEAHMINRRIILASGSPRRHEILTLAHIPHEILTADADEHSIRFEPGRPEEYVLSIAGLKNAAVCGRLSGESAVVISADTIVYDPATDSPIGKPKDPADARRILTSLSGGVHLVITGVVIRDTASGRTSQFAEVTEVHFKPLSHEEIDAYVDSGDPLDKAGAYGMQSGGCIFVERIVGDYFNVIGLPICRLNEELKQFS